MSHSRASAEVNARIVYWGIEGAGKRTNLTVIHAKLRPDHRGELREVPTRLDPSVHYAVLPIELGEVSGVRTRIQVMTAPAGAEQALTRRQLLDRVDGIVFVADARRERLSENLASFEELRTALAAYGRTPEQVPLVLQYNKRDLSDPYALEELHRKLGLRGAAAFEAVAREGGAVLQTLTTISKRVIRHRREQTEREQEAAAPASPSPPPGTTQLLLQLTEPTDDEREPEAPANDFEAQPEQLTSADEAFFASSLPDAADALAANAPSEPSPAALVELEGVGEARLTGPHSLSLPLRIRDAAGQSRSITLRIQLEAVLEPAS